MEIEPSFVSILLSFLLFVFMVLKIGKRSKATKRTLNLPPGPLKLPIIGNLHQLVGALLHQRLRDLAMKYGPLMRQQLGQVSTVVVSSPELAREVMKTHDVIFPSRPQFLTSKVLFYNSNDIVFSPYGDYRRQLRKICSFQLLNMKRVQSFRSIREEDVSNLIDWISSKAGSPIHLTERLHLLTFGVTSGAACGKRYEEQKSFESIVIETTKLASGFSIADLFPSIEGLLQWVSGIKPQLEKQHQESDIRLENIINEHKKDKTTLDVSKHEKIEDLVDILLQVQEKDDSEFQLTADNIKAVIWDVFGAGVEVSATAIDWALSELTKKSKGDDKGTS